MASRTGPLLAPSSSAMLTSLSHWRCSYLPSRISLHSCEAALSEFDVPRQNDLLDEAYG